MCEDLLGLSVGNVCPELQAQNCGHRVDPARDRSAHMRVIEPFSDRWPRAKPLVSSVPI